MIVSLNGRNPRRRNVKWSATDPNVLQDNEFRAINKFIEDTFVSELNKNKGTFIAVRDVYGGKNRDFAENGDPMQIIYKMLFIRYNGNYDKAYAETAKILGYLVANVLHDSKDSFERRKIWRATEYRRV